MNNRKILGHNTAGGVSHKQEYKPTGGKKADLIRHKGFYAALYSCVGAMLVLAVVIGYNNFKPREDGDVTGIPEDGYALETDIGQDGLDQNSLDQNAALANGLTSEGLIPDDGFSQESSPVSIGVDSYLNDLPQTEADGVIENDPSDSTMIPEDFTSSMADPMDNPDDLTAEGDNQTGVSTDEAEPIGETAGEDELAMADLQARRNEDQSPNFTSFDESSETMVWPLLGDIVMDYSVDHLIYDRTLEQYRTNDNVCIGAVEGTPVTASAEGIVKDVFTTRENGRTVIVEHGNGWVTTYSQLQDSVLVQVGNVVEKGQQLGEVGTPSMYSSQLGSHLEFSVTKSDQPVNPHTVLR